MAMVITSASYHFWPAIIAAPQIVAIVGLSFDLAGVTFLVVFPPSYFPEPSFLMLEQQARFAELYGGLRDQLSWIGLPAVVFGFGLQIIANLFEIS